MNTWMSRCRRQAKCTYCPEPILKGTYMVVVQVFTRDKRDGDSRCWWLRLRFHPQCWIDQAIAALEKRPTVDARDGHPLKITDGDKAARFAILRRRASTVQRIKREIAKPSEEQSTDRIIHFGDLLNKQKEEIELLGGVPKSWK